MDEFRNGSDQSEPWEQPKRNEWQPPQNNEENHWQRPQGGYHPYGEPGMGGFQFEPRRKGRPRIFSGFLMILLIASMVTNWFAISTLRDEVETLQNDLRLMDEDGDWSSDEDDGWGSGDSRFQEPTIPQLESIGNPQITLLPSQPGGAALSSVDVYQQCINSVVYIRISGGGGSEGSGVMMSRDGYIITNAHVVEGGRRADVTLHDGSKYTAQLVGYDWAADLAILKIEGENFSAARFADSDGLMVGQRVAAMGSPWGYELKDTMSQGVLSGLNRELYHNMGKAKFIQFDAAVSSGSSGGALIDEYGRVIGIVTMKYVVDMDYESYVENLSFAIPMTEAKVVLDEIIKYGSVRRRPNIGVTLNPLTDEQKEDRNLDAGLLVVAVTPDSPAERAGIELGDVLLSADGETLYGTGDLLAVRNEKEYGDMILFTAERDGRTEVFELVFE